MTPAETSVLRKPTVEMVKKYNINPWFRLDWYYPVLNRQGKMETFRCEPIQRKILEESHGHPRVLELKPRGVGSSLLWLLTGLDECLFVPGTKMAIVAHDQDRALDLFRDHIRFPYDNMLVSELRPRFEVGTQGSKSQLVLANGSSITVDVSLESGTFQILISTEFGPMSVLDPAKASEFVRASLEAVRDDPNHDVYGRITIESTSGGPTGEFRRLWETYSAMNAADKAGTYKLAKNDFKTIFIGWQDDPMKTDASPIVIVKELDEYFARLKSENGITLTDQQKFWYSRKAVTQGYHMKTNYPSTPDEAFSAMLEGCVWSRELMKAEAEGRISEFRYDPRYLVNTAWDIGEDGTAIWHYQEIGNGLHFIDFDMEIGPQFGLSYFLDFVKSKPWAARYGYHIGPHDLNHTMQNGQKVSAFAGQHGIKFQVVPRAQNKFMDSIETGRMFLSRCSFDKKRCQRGIDFLRAYRLKKDRATGQFMEQAVHDDSSHAADAFQQAAMWHDYLKGRMSRGKRKTETQIVGMFMGS